MTCIMSSHYNNQSAEIGPTNVTISFTVAKLQQILMLFILRTSVMKRHGSTRRLSAVTESRDIKVLNKQEVKIKGVECCPSMEKTSDRYQDYQKLSELAVPPSAR